MSGKVAKVPWTNADFCYACKVEFDVFERRHHCRSCGLSCCGPCSPGVAFVPGYDDVSPLRVCKKCQAHLRQRSSSSCSPSNASPTKTTFTSEGLRQRRARETSSPTRSSSRAASPQASDAGLTSSSPGTTTTSAERACRHHFAVKTLSVPTYCAFCEGFIWGLVKQAHCCEVCGICIHRHCLPTFDSSDAPSAVPATSSSRARSSAGEQESLQEGTSPIISGRQRMKDGGVESMRGERRSGKGHASNQSQGRFSDGKSTDMSSPAETKASRGDGKKPPASTPSKALGDSPDRAGSTPQKQAGGKSSPQFSTSTNLRNYARYIARLGVLIYVENWVEETLKFTFPSRSWLCIGLWILCNFYPASIFFLPFIFLLTFFQSFPSGERVSLSMGRNDTAKSKQSVIYEHMAYAQNSMAKYTAFYNQWKVRFQKLASLPEKERQHELFRLAIVGAIGFALASMYWGLVILLFRSTVFVAGLLPFAVANPSCYGLLKGLLQHLHLWEHVQYSIRELGLDAQLVTVVENQRWWLAVGWQHTKQSPVDPAAFTNDAGEKIKIQVSRLAEYRPPAGYDWAPGSFWELEISDLTDSQGWEYTDNTWMNPTAERKAGGMYTRSRRWVRTSLKQLA